MVLDECRDFVVIISLSNLLRWFVKFTVHLNFPFRTGFCLWFCSCQNVAIPKGSEYLASLVTLELYESKYPCGIFRIQNSSCTVQLDIIYLSLIHVLLRIIVEYLFLKLKSLYEFMKKIILYLPYLLIGRCTRTY